MYIVKFVILACIVCIFCFLIFALKCIARINLVEGLLLPFLYIHTCVIFNKCIQTLKNSVLPRLLCIRMPYSASAMFVTHGIPSFYELLRKSIYNFIILYFVY